MKSPEISIITPTYQHAPFIEQCLESVRAQTYFDWEQIIIDDGSTDGTWDLIQKISTTDSRYRLLRVEHKGPENLAELYNLALYQARGKWIAILEGDDYWLPNKLSVQMSAITNNTLVCYSAYLDDREGILSIGHHPPFRGSIPVKDFIVYLLMHQSHLIAVTQMIRKEAVLSIGGFRQDGSPAAVDVATMLHLVKLPGEIIYIPEPYGVWRHHPQQSTNLRGVDLAITNMHMVLKFFDSLTPFQKKELGIERDDIIKVRYEVVSDAYFGALRNQLRYRDGKKFRDLICGTWKYGGLKRRIQVLYAVFAYAFRLDFEWILPFFEHPGQNYKLIK